MLLEHEGAEADRVDRLLFQRDVGWVNRRGGFHEVEAGISGRAQGDFQRVIVDLLQALDRVGLARAEFLHALDDGEVAGARQRVRGGREALIREDEVVGGQRLSVVEDRVLLQMVGIGGAVIGDVDRIRQFQHRGVGMGIPRIQAAMDRVGEELFLDVRAGLRVQRREGGAIGRREVECTTLARFVGRPCQRRRAHAQQRSE